MKVTFDPTQLFMALVIAALGVKFLGWGPVIVMFVVTMALGALALAIHVGMQK